MDKNEKFAAIVGRMKGDTSWMCPTAVSVMLITSYLHDLTQRGFVAGGYTISKTGKDVVAICEEFDWKPSNEEVIEYVNEMVAPEDREAFAYLIFKYRDDREELLETLKKYNK